MSEKTRARFEIIVDMLVACIWCLFEGLWVGIKHAGGIVAGEWRQARVEWAVSGHLED